MGPGLAQVFATAGHPVSLYSRTQRRSTRRSHSGRHFARSSVTGWSRKRTLRGARPITPTTSLVEAGAGAGVVVETVVEDLEAKRAVFAELDAFCPDGAMFTSTTSYLDSSRSCRSDACRHAHRALVRAAAHRPAGRGGRGEHTSEATVAAVVALLEGLGKAPVVLDRFVPGFCVNRILRSIGREVFYLLDNGYVTPSSSTWPSDPASRRGPWSSAWCSGTTSPAST